MAEPPEDWRPHLGRKVSLRYRLHDDPDHPYSEAVGVVAAASADAITLFDRRGRRVTIPISDIEAARIFPG